MPRCVDVAEHMMALHYYLGNATPENARWTPNPRLPASLSWLVASMMLKI
ncbi:hypothetical protein M405DRAFT_868702 [Rhizopogon salebrosus TDB-379]|nr:hypothetical protein M405DRAFT_868702 [Rhizopogon salebrosus TDB-379]